MDSQEPTVQRQMNKKSEPLPTLLRGDCLSNTTGCRRQRHRSHPRRPHRPWQRHSDRQQRVEAWKS